MVALLNFTGVLPQLLTGSREGGQVLAGVLVVERGKQLLVAVQAIASYHPTSRLSRLTEVDK